MCVLNKNGGLKHISLGKVGNPDVGASFPIACAEEVKLLVAGIKTTFGTVDNQYTIICEKIKLYNSGGVGDPIVSSIEAIIAVSKAQMGVTKCEISLLWWHCMHHNNVDISTMVRLYCIVSWKVKYIFLRVLLL